MEAQSLNVCASTLSLSPPVSPNYFLSSPSSINHSLVVLRAVCAHQPLVSWGSVQWLNVIRPSSRVVLINR